MLSRRARWGGLIGAAIGIFVAVAVASGAFGATAGPASEEPVEPVRVMFVGDSITGGPGCWRAALWVALTDAGHAIDAVGVRTEDECGGVTNAAGQVWDPDNEGIGSMSALGQFNRLASRGTYGEYQPDVVVMLLGTNDVRGGENVEDLIGAYDLLLAQAREANPRIAVVLGTLPPISPSDCAACPDVIAELTPRLVSWGAENSTSDSPVSIARLGVGFDPEVHTDDGLHPNAAGDAVLAQAWFEPVQQAVLRVEGRRQGGGLPVWVYAAVAVTLAASGAGLVLRSWGRR